VLKKLDPTYRQRLQAQRRPAKMTRRSVRFPPAGTLRSSLSSAHLNLVPKTVLWSVEFLVSSSTPHRQDDRLRSASTRSPTAESCLRRPPPPWQNRRRRRQGAHNITISCPKNRCLFSSRWRAHRCPSRHQNCRSVIIIIIIIICKFVVCKSIKPKQNNGSRLPSSRYHNKL